jgi:molybdenum cofactor biosynthesis protein B
MEGMLNISVLTVSDTRSREDDTSGQYLVDALLKSGHKLVARELVKDNIYAIRAVVSQWIADDEVQVVLTTGGTGFSARDNTPEAISLLIEKEINGFGELFRSVSYLEIGTSTVQSRALAGLVNNTLIFCLPGSTGACRTGWEKILREQLDINNSPCNFAELFNN